MGTRSRQPNGFRRPAARLAVLRAGHHSLCPWACCTHPDSQAPSILTTWPHIPNSNGPQDQPLPETSDKPRLGTFYKIPDQRSPTGQPQEGGGTGVDWGPRRPGDSVRWGLDPILDRRMDVSRNTGKIQGWSGFLGGTVPQSPCWR